MVWIGIGLIIIGLALFGLIGVLLKPLTKAANVLEDVKETTKDLPEKVDGILTQVNGILTDVRGTLGDVNGKLKQLNPLFYLIGDIGTSTRSLSHKMIERIDAYKEIEPDSLVKRNNLEGLYGLVTLVVMALQRGKGTKVEREVVDDQ